MLRGKVLAVVLARDRSSRFPRKHLQDIEGKSLFERVIDRLRRCEEIHEIILATGPELSNAAVVGEGRRLQVPIYADHDESDVTGRVVRASQSFGAEWVVTVSGDCPLLDSALIDQMVKALRISSADTLLFNPKPCLHEGVTVRSLKGWAKIEKVSTEPKHKEHPGYVLNEKKEVLSGTTFRTPKALQRNDFRVSVDTLADLDFVRAIYRRQGVDHFSLESVADLFDSNEELRSIHAHVVQRKVDKQYPTIGILTHGGATVGMGHLRRVQCLGRELVEAFGYGVKVWAMAPEEGIRSLREQLFGVTLLSDDCAEEIVEKCRIAGIQQLIVDMNKEGFEAVWPRLIESNLELIVIDQRPSSLRDRLFILIPNLEIGRLKVFATETKQPVFVGKDYLLLDRQICRIRNRNLPKRDEILVLFGGGKFPDEFLGVLTSLGKHLACRVILGPMSPNQDEVIDRFHGSQMIKVDVSPADLLEKMARAKLILGRFGVTTFEAAALGTPSFITGVARESDVPFVELLEAWGCSFNGLGVEDVSASVGRLLDEGKSIEAAAKACLRTFDAQSLNRAAKEIVRFVEGTNG